MSDHLSTQPPDQLASAGADAVESPEAGQGALRCQWCSVPLSVGVTICPTCGSPGIPDPRMTVAGLAEPEVRQPDPVREAVAARGVAGGEVELVEWWRNEASVGELDEEPRQTMDFAEIERRRMQSLIFIGGAVLACALLGWLIGPTLLEGPFENLTGTTVDDPDDLRNMGTIGGLVIGMFVGSTAGWVIWSNK